VGPVDIVIENNRIARVVSVGNPQVPIRDSRRPAPGDHEIDAHGMYVLPGLVNAHAHVAFPLQGIAGEVPDAEYVFKLWLGHGITTVREVGSFTALDEAAKRDLETACHHAQLAVSRMNVLDTSGWGLTSMEHWYGLPEALFADRTIQDYPANYNYNDEQHRFGAAGRLWEQAAPPGSARWRAVLDTLVARNFTLCPTLTIYEASRDLMRAMRAEWHDDYTLPTLWRWYAPSREAHGSYWFHWTTADEIAWKHNYQRWMTFLNDFKNRGGRVVTGEDAGFIYKLFGFAYVRELELLQEAGFHPLEVVRAASLNGAEVLGMADEIGSVEVGKRADLLIVEENPLANFKVLYGTGALRLDDATGEVVRVGAVRWTVKDGIVYDAPALLADVRRIVAEAKAREAQETPED